MHLNTPNCLISNDTDVWKCTVYPQALAHLCEVPDTACIQCQLQLLNSNTYHSSLGMERRGFQRHK